MADGIEQIESRLAAYIDGELADADRAEIEKYLAANPSHRQLIMELKQQRAQIASLPRESAPVEVLDHLQSHLERQALLENVEDGADSMRINRWPQWTAVAAMLLLTVGLGALVFSVLPGGALNHETVAIAPPAVQNLPAAPSLDAKEADEARDAVASAGTRRPDDADTFASKNAGKSAEAEEAARLATRDKLETTLNDAMTLDVPGRPETGGAPATAPGSESVELYNGSAIIVSTDDPLITQNLLAGYLGQNNFEYTPVRAEIAKASVAAAQSASSSNSQVTGEGAANQELSVQVENTSSQQALGSIVARVNAKDSLVTNGEQYLLVRNLSPADAQRINSVINTQRGIRQQARFYDNRDLYPEFAQQAQQYGGQQQQQQQLQQQMPLTQQREALAENDQKTAGERQRMSKAASAATTDPEHAVAEPAEAAKPDEPVPATAQQTEAGSRDEAAATQPTADPQPLRTDVLIVVRSDPKLDTPAPWPAETQPSTQPATQPSDESPAGANTPVAPAPEIDIQLAPQLPPPASQPTTQPTP